MNFGEALDLLKSGKKMQRSGWNGKGMHIALQVPDEHSKMGRPYLYIFGADKLMVPWVVSQTDLMAEDWGIVD